MAQLEKILPPSTRSVKSGLRARRAEKIESIKDDSKENHSVARGSKRPWPPCKVSSDTRRRICVWMTLCKTPYMQQKNNPHVVSLGASLLVGIVGGNSCP